MTDLQRLQDELGDWQDETFGNSGPDGCLAHLKKEIEELITDPYDRMEYADCFMLLIGAYRRTGGSADDLVTAAFQKLTICKSREWGEPDENGVVEHIRN